MFHGTLAEQVIPMGLSPANCQTWYYHIQDDLRDFIVTTPPRDQTPETEIRVVKLRV